MSYKNPRELLVDATKLPAAIEGKLPARAPKISAMLVKAANMLPALPDFIVGIPELPNIPMPGAPAPTPAAAPLAKARQRIVNFVFE